MNIEQCDISSSLLEANLFFHVALVMWGPLCVTWAVAISNETPWYMLSSANLKSDLGLVSFYGKWQLSC